MASDLLFFDTDCLSAFLWVGEECLLSKLYSCRIVIPEAVYSELSHPGVVHLKARVDAMVEQGVAEVAEIIYGTSVWEDYFTMTCQPAQGHKLIGKGEAASIALARDCAGIVASNNLRDIMAYIQEYSLNYVTTGDILVEAFQKQLITEEQGNQIWREMLAKRRKLGALSFSEYLCLKV